jgi:flagellar hook-length control protein FliK
MSVSAIDTLMQLAAPARPVEPPARSASRPGTFAPALESAYGGDKLREPAPPVEEEDQVAVAVDDENGSGGRAPESSDESEETEASAAPAGRAEESDDEGPADEVEISELASTVIAANPAQAASAVAPDDEAALQLVQAADVNGGDGEEAAQNAAANASNGGEGSDQSDAQASAVYGKAIVDSDEYVFGVGKPSADAKGKAAKTGKASHVKEGPSTIASGDTKAVAETPAEAERDSARLEAESAAKNLTVEESTSDKSPGSESNDTKAHGSDGVERVKLPPVEPTAELALAIERHVAAMEQAGSAGAEASSAPSTAGTPAEAAGNAAAPAKSQGMLDRLAAASMRRNEGSGASEGEHAIDRQRFVQRVEGAMRAAQQRDGRVQVRLAPPELGSLRIELSVHNGVMAAKLEAETPAARNALLDNLPALRERMAEQNIRIEKFDVDVRRDSQGSGGHNAAFDGRDSRHEAGSHERRERSAPLPPPKTTPARATRTTTAATDAGLDVRI